MNPNDPIARITAAMMGGQGPAPAEGMPPGGPPPGMPGQPPAGPAGMAAMGGPPPKPPETPPTQLEQGEASMAPKTEGAAMAADPVMYEIPFGEGSRKLTAEQIKGTFDRYSQLSYEKQQLGPFMDLGRQLMERVPKGTDPAKVVEAMTMALSKNPQMNGGNQMQLHAGQDGGKTQSNEDISAQLEQWEKENAASLPPGYKDMMQQIKGMAPALTAMQQMMQQMMGQQHGNLDAAREAQQFGQQREVEVRRQLVANNLGKVQQELGLPDEAQQDFMVFMGERGYTLEDFMDYNLLKKVAGDFKATAATPEMERLRQIHQRRQAFTGTLGGQPGGSAGVPAQQQSKTPLDGMIDFAMQRKGMA